MTQHKVYASPKAKCQRLWRIQLACYFPWRCCVHYDLRQVGHRNSRNWSINVMGHLITSFPVLLFWRVLPTGETRLWEGSLLWIGLIFTQKTMSFSLWVRVECFWFFMLAAPFLFACLFNRIKCSGKQETYIQAFTSSHVKYRYEVMYRIILSLMM